MVQCLDNLFGKQFWIIGEDRMKVARSNQNWGVLGIPRRGWDDLTLPPSKIGIGKVQE